MIKVAYSLIALDATIPLFQPCFIHAKGKNKGIFFNEVSSYKIFISETLF